MLLCILHTFSKGHIYFIIKNKKLKTLQQVRKTFQTYTLSILAWKIRGLGYCSYLSQTGGKSDWSQGWFGPWLQQLAQPAISRDPFHTVGGNVIWSSHCGEQFGGSLKKKIDVSYDLVIPHLGTYPDKTLFVYSKRYTNPSVHSSSIYNSQDMATA